MSQPAFTTAHGTQTPQAKPLQQVLVSVWTWVTYWYWWSSCPTSSQGLPPLIPLGTSSG